MMALARSGKCCRMLLSEPSKAVYCGVVKPGWIESCTGAKRHLLPDDVIKLNDFQQKKLNVAQRSSRPKEYYFAQIGQKLQKKEYIPTDDLKLLLHLCESADDMVLVREAVYRYHTENRNLEYGKFKFGPIFMRLCYELGLEDLAAATVTDESMKGFFNDISSFNIAIDMLFNKGSYEKALEVLRTMKTLNKGSLILAFGTCYKMNTAESYRICTALMEEQQTKGRSIPRHAYCFAVALALRQNDIEKAQSLFSQIMDTDSRLCQNLKVVILTMSGAVKEALSILSGALFPKAPSFVKKPDFSQEIVDLLRSQSKDKLHMMEVEQIVTQLEQANQVTQQTLDDMLCHIPSVGRKPVMRKTSQRTLKPLHSTLLSE